METITGSDHTKLRLFSFNIFIITISMVMLAVSSNPVYSEESEVVDELDLDSLESIPLDTKCVLIAPEYSENGLVRRKRSDNKFKFGILGLANVDLITTILDSKSRQKNTRPAPRPTADRKLMELMTRNGR